MRARHATPQLCLHPAMLPRLSRPALESIVEATLAELDRRDGDPDLEPEPLEDSDEDMNTGDAEPSTENMPAVSTAWARGPSDPYWTPKYDPFWD